MTCGTQYAVSLEATLLCAGVPGVAAFGLGGAQAFAELFNVVGQGELGDVFQALVTELAGNAHAQWAAKSDRKFAAVYFVCEKSLRMERVGHVNAFPPVRLERAVDHVAHLRQGANPFEDVRKRNAGPFGDIGPPFFALNQGDVAAARKALELGERERRGASHQAVNSEAPAGERFLLVPLELVA